jgi:hypothetical protein
LFKAFLSDMIPSTGLLYAAFCNDGKLEPALLVIRGLAMCRRRASFSGRQDGLGGSSDGRMGKKEVVFGVCG